jgi:hypothetical protein
MAIEEVMIEQVHPGDAESPPPGRRQWRENAGL